MPGFANIAEFAGANAAGRTHVCSFRKVPSQATTATWWADLSMASGNPVPNYYAAAPLTLKTLDDFDGIFHGDDKAPASKHLTHFGLMTPTAAMVGQYMLLDYLAYYPFLDGDSGDEQAMVNTVPLPRYADGAGVQMMAVNVAPTTGGGTFTVTYVNQDGVTKTTPVQTCSSTANIATLTTSATVGPFLQLAAGDTGVRSVISVTFGVANGGLIALVLVKPIITLAIREINTMTETAAVQFYPGAPRIYDGAYLNLIGQCAGSIAAGQLTGYASFAWSDD